MTTAWRTQVRITEISAHTPKGTAARSSWVVPVLPIFDHLRDWAGFQKRLRTFNMDSA